MNAPIFTKLTIVDANNNTIAIIPATDGKITLAQLFDHLLYNSAQTQSIFNNLVQSISELQNEVRDLKEAFEHTDDSVAKLRERINGDNKTP
jgi:peptidoglycan hydrolase CwlO-like protein